MIEIKQRRAFETVLLIGLCVGVAACHSKSSETGAKAGVVIARVGSQTVTVQDLDARLKEQSPLVRPRYSTPERKKELLEESIRMSLLTQEAHRRGLDKDPEVQRTLDRILVQRLLREAVDTSKTNSITTEELKAYYDKHPAEFSRPERIRVSQLVLAVPSNVTKKDAAWGKARADAEKLRKDIVAATAKGPGHSAFEDAARTRSTDLATRPSGGDLAMRTRPELEQTLGKEVAQAVFALKDVGEISPVVESERGFYLFKLTARQPGMEQNPEAARPMITARLAQEHRSHALDEFIAGLRQSAKVEIDESALAQVGSPAAPPSPAPTPGH